MHMSGGCTKTYHLCSSSSIYFISGYLILTNINTSLNPCKKYIKNFNLKSTEFREKIMITTE